MARKIEKYLFEKFINNRCTPEEMAVFIQSLRQLKHAEELPAVEDILERVENLPQADKDRSEEMLREILSDIKKKETPVIQLRPWRYAAVAAVCVLLLGIGYKYWPSALPVSSTPPSDAITLEMEDGTFKIIEEGENLNIKNTLGTVVKQEDDALIYDDEKHKELVYNTLTVPYGKRFKLRLSDHTLVELNAGSSLRYPVNFIPGKDREVHLNGEAFFEVAKDAKHRFKVTTDELKVQVFGTRFNLSSYPEDPTASVVLVEGSVALYTDTTKNKPDNHTLLTPGYKGTLLKHEGHIKTEAVPTDLYTSWREGSLVFRNMSFENILKKLERHYNVRIENHNRELANTMFNASFGRESLTNVLENLHTVYGFDYTINENHVTIH